MPDTVLPALRAQLLSNGRYRVLVTEAGGGCSRLGHLALTRWIPDRTRDADGVFLYVRDLETGDFWSAAHQPVRHPAVRHSTRFLPGGAEFRCENDRVESRLEIAVCPQQDREFRRVTVTNRDSRPRRLDVTTYATVVLNTAAADAAHPAFSNLFVQTAFLPGREVLLATRRPRNPSDPPIWLAHSLVCRSGTPSEPLQYETDRARFIGRGMTPAEPVALTSAAPLSGTVGDVLDPVLSARRVVVLGPGASAQLVAVFGVAASRDAAVDLVAVGAAPRVVDAAFEEASRRAREDLARREFTDVEVEQLQRLTWALAYGAPTPEGSAEEGGFEGATPADLVALGLAPGIPFAYLPVRAPGDRASLGLVARAVGWWRAQGAETQLLVLLDSGLEADAGLMREVAALGDAAIVRRTDQVPPGLRRLVRSAAQFASPEAVLSAPASTAEADLAGAPLRPSAPAIAMPVEEEGGAVPLRFFNGYGGFSQDGTEYVIRLGWESDRLVRPPLPWTNVIANESAGFIVSESGAGATWSANSRENRLTPWFNDPVSDPHGEAFYLRDEDTGLFWSPTPGPLPGNGPYEVSHGFGYSRFRHQGLALEQDLVLFVAPSDPVKLGILRLTNHSRRARRLSFYAYVEWVLGSLRQDTARFVVTERDGGTGALLATNAANGEFAARVACAAVVAPPGAGPLEVTGDRLAFLGPLGSTASPAVVASGRPLGGSVGRGLDPCAAFRLFLHLEPEATLECGFVLGQAEDRTEALALVRRYGSVRAQKEALETVREQWRRTLSAVQVETPSPALDLMVNGWLAYQNLSCRMLGRSALYQSGGAYGFRDQLQDAAALVYLVPSLTRRQIVLHAAHQFAGGDVLHWWHPPLDKGIRSRCSDDMLWLPYVTAFYLRVTGDRSVLDEPVSFLHARPLQAGEDEAYLVPQHGSASASLYEHCCRALDRSLTQGRHGLPLIGTCDWNDGMNRVGREGKGESVWLGFFLYAALESFVPHCIERDDAGRVTRYRAYQKELGAALNGPGWDGAWYRRAFYDDGTPLGSAADDECRIDAIAQAWAVLSGVAPPERAAQALDALERHLVDEAGGIIRLLTPPFDRTPRDPGYIKGYVPGVRENGGQYTHGALWAVRALAEFGRAGRAAHLLEMLSPVHHARSREAADRYRVEPYVIAADVYGVAPHLGRGGWTWYTGSAGWMFRVALESVLGVTVSGDRLLLRPCLPPDWPGYTLRYRLPDGRTTYEVRVHAMQGRGHTTVSGRGVQVRTGVVVIELERDGGAHQIEVELGGDVGPGYRPRVFSS